MKRDERNLKVRKASDGTYVLSMDDATEEMDIWYAAGIKSPVLKISDLAYQAKMFPKATFKDIVCAAVLNKTLHTLVHRIGRAGLSNSGGKLSASQVRRKKMQGVKNKRRKA